MRHVLAFMIAISPVTASSEAIQVLMTCGASKGWGYYFTDPIFNSSGANWVEDGISNGTINLVSQGTELDILFGDAVGSKGYRADGAAVIYLGGDERYYRVGAIHPNYADIYTFDMVSRKVVWSSNKSGPLASKVVVYEADCR